MGDAGSLSVRSGFFSIGLKTYLQWCLRSGCRSPARHLRHGFVIAAPWIVIFEASLSMLRRSLGVSSTARAPMFSSRRNRLVVPGMGTIHGFWASTQGSAIWAGVAFFRCGSGRLLRPGKCSRSNPN